MRLGLQGRRIWRRWCGVTVLFVRSRAGRFVAWLMLGLVGAAGAVLYAWALLKIPDRMHLHDPQDRYNARILVISVGGAVVVGLGLLYTARTYSLSHRGQITDRFTKALEQLDADQLYVRVGGIQALGRLMHDSPIHHDYIIEVLTAFVRDRAPMTPSAPPVAESPPADVQAALTVLAHRPRRPERRAAADAPPPAPGGAAPSAPRVSGLPARPAPPSS